MTEEQLKEKYLGKKVSVRADTIFQKNSLITGTCTFIGYNPLLKSEWITIDRTPIPLKHYRDIVVLL